MVKFCIEKLVKDKAYPNLSTLKATPYTKKWREFSINSPFSEPVMLFEYLNEHDIKYDIVSIDEADDNTFYPIALSYFDFDINWFELMPTTLLSKLKDKSIKVLFYYSEGDNPYIIDEHLTKQCNDNNIPREQILFVSANSKAKNIDNFLYMADDELLFRLRNRENLPIGYSEHTRNKKFTALVRMHKYWRANIMSTLWQQRLDTDGYFAYGNEITANEKEEDNPIEVDKFYGLRERTRIFLKSIPFTADALDSDGHNDHTQSVLEHYNDSYINVVLESHMDVDQSNGILLTEKTFKPIKNAQMFIIFGACGSLKLLREMGYKTFDHVLDNKYDTIQNTTERWKTAMDMVTKVLSRSKDEIHNMYITCKDDLVHNQDLFNASKLPQLNRLLKEMVDD